ncbi:DUF167 domain-containing protein [Candidatus Saccharibacteria bacterium]|nr:DUF167 domain-containing protein [Candidatus Saccharibacteria bacterium]
MPRRITVFVKTGVKTPARLEKTESDSFIAYLNARAHDGEANRALVELIAASFSVPKTSIVIVRGHKSRHKLLEINA